MFAITSFLQINILHSTFVFTATGLSWRHHAAITVDIVSCRCLRLCVLFEQEPARATIVSGRDRSRFEEQRPESVSKFQFPLWFQTTRFERAALKEGRLGVALLDPLDGKSHRTIIYDNLMHT